jgi:hypothetical protein
MGFRSWQRIALAVSSFLLALGMLGPADAAEPGQVLWTFYETVPSVTEVHQSTSGAGAAAQPFFNGGNGDNILRLINPNGAANGNLAGAKEQTVCAMLYVFDPIQEMGECCGCPISSSGLLTFSVEKNLISEWGLGGFPAPLDGSIAIVATTPNAPACLGQSSACNGGCDPTNLPGYSVTTANNLLGSMTHNQLQAEIDGEKVLPKVGVTETTLSDDSSGDPTNIIYLQNQCGAIVGNGSGGAICNCPLA